jgi:hypothetical protein
MAKRKKVMNAVEMEKWLMQKGATPVTKETRQKPWYKEVSKLPACMEGAEPTGEDR